MESSKLMHAASMLRCRKEGAGAGPTTPIQSKLFSTQRSWQVSHLSGAVGAGTLFARVLEADCDGKQSTSCRFFSLVLSKALTAPANAVDDPLAHGAPGATALENLWGGRGIQRARMSDWVIVF